MEAAGWLEFTATDARPGSETAAQGRGGNPGVGSVAVGHPPPPCRVSTGEVGNAADTSTSAARASVPAADAATVSVTNHDVDAPVPAFTHPAYAPRRVSVCNLLRKVAPDDGGTPQRCAAATCTVTARTPTGCHAASNAACTTAAVALTGRGGVGVRRHVSDTLPSSDAPGLNKASVVTVTPVPRTPDVLTVSCGTLPSTSKKMIPQRHPAVVPTRSGSLVAPMAPHAGQSVVSAAASAPASMSGDKPRDTSRPPPLLPPPPGASTVTVQVPAIVCPEPAVRLTATTPCNGEVEADTVNAMLRTASHAGPHGDEVAAASTDVSAATAGVDDTLVPGTSVAHRSLALSAAALLLLLALHQRRMFAADTPVQVPWYAGAAASAVATDDALAAATAYAAAAAIASAPSTAWQPRGDCVGTVMPALQEPGTADRKPCTFGGGVPLTNAAAAATASPDAVMPAARAAAVNRQFHAASSAPVRPPGGSCRAPVDARAAASMVDGSHPTLPLAPGAGIQAAHSTPALPTFSTASLIPLAGADKTADRMAAQGRDKGVVRAASTPSSALVTATVMSCIVSSAISAAAVAGSAQLDAVAASRAQPMPGTSTGVSRSRPLADALNPNADSMARVYVASSQPLPGNAAPPPPTAS